MKLFKNKYAKNFLINILIISFKNYKMYKNISVSFEKSYLLQQFLQKNFILFYNLDIYLSMLKKQLNVLYNHFSRKLLFIGFTSINFTNIPIKYLKIFNRYLSELGGNHLINFISSTLGDVCYKNKLFSYFINKDLKRFYFNIYFKFSKKQNSLLMFTFLKIVFFRLKKHFYQIL